MLGILRPEMSDHAVSVQVWTRSLGTSGGRNRGRPVDGTPAPLLEKEYVREELRTVCRWQRADLRTKFPATDGPIPRWVCTIRTAASCAPVQVRDSSVLDEAFRDAFDCSSGGQVCTNLTQLRNSARQCDSDPNGTSWTSRARSGAVTIRARQTACPWGIAACVARREDGTRVSHSRRYHAE